jgi:hypothetical protein
MAMELILKLQSKYLRRRATAESKPQAAGEQR